MIDDTLEVAKPIPAGLTGVLNPQALDFLGALVARFGARRERLMAKRKERQAAIDAGATLDFLPATAEIRTADWQVAPPPAALVDRRVEITGPPDRKMVVNALNSGARAFMADFEDSHSPQWEKTLQGQLNLIDACRRTITFDDPVSGKHYQLNEQTATIIVRPRGWHLPEDGILHQGRPIPGALMDFALFFCHNAKLLHDAGAGPFFYLPKTEHYEEAELWSDILVYAEGRFGLPAGATKVTLLIETLPAVFQMHEILHALKNNITGLNCGRWDYIFSYVKAFRINPERILPDRTQVTMAVPFLDAYSKLLVRTCHLRGAHAMGGMAAQVPIRNDPAANEKVYAKVQADKLREVGNGHDGSWVAHPGLVTSVTQVFDDNMAGPHQKDFLANLSYTAADLTAHPEGTTTREGFDQNIQIALRYLAAWFDGLGAVQIFNLMEDVATTEIARAQLWQQVHYGVKFADGSVASAALFKEHLGAARANIGDEGGSNLALASELLTELVLADELVDFFTSIAYPRLG